MGGSREPRAPGDVLVHLRRARDHADRHYAEPVDLDTMASVAGLSRYHFLRLFRSTYGVTPAAYVSRRRIERAQDLLRTTTLQPGVSFDGPVLLVDDRIRSRWTLTVAASLLAEAGATTVLPLALHQLP